MREYGRMNLGRCDGGMRYKRSKWRYENGYLNDK